MNAPLLPTLAVLGFFTAFALPGRAESPDAGTAAGFTAMLQAATLEGTWAPISGNRVGAEKADRYEVARAEQQAGDRWIIVWKVTRQGQPIEYPIPSVVKFAGDSAVLILDEVPIGDGKAWSARVLFHRDTYAGRWWGGDGKGGTVSGIVRRTAAP